MTKIIPVLLFILTACAGTPPAVASTSTPLPTIPSTVISTPTIQITSTLMPTNEILATAAFANERVSTVDGMPQVFIPAGTFWMGDMDVRAAAD